jgi:hypothetical protein
VRQLTALQGRHLEDAVLCAEHYLVYNKGWGWADLLGDDGFDALLATVLRVRWFALRRVPSLAACGRRSLRAR